MNKSLLDLPPPPLASPPTGSQDLASNKLWNNRANECIKFIKLCPVYIFGDWGNQEGSYFIMGSIFTLAWLTPIIKQSPNSAGKSFLDKGTLLTIAFI